MRSFRINIYQTIVLFLLLSCISLRAQETLSATFNAGMGYLFGREAAKTTAIFEPGIDAVVDENNTLQLSSLIYRPTDPYFGFEIPWVRARYWHRLSLSETWGWKLLGQISALGVHDWKNEGPSLRNAFGVETSRELFLGSRLGFRLTPFWQWNRFSQNTQGAKNPTFGCVERLAWEWELRDWIFEVDLTFTQSLVGEVNYEFGIGEQVGYRIAPGALISLSHALSTNFIDYSTGRRKIFRIFDEQGSQLSLMVRLAI